MMRYKTKLPPLLLATLVLITSSGVLAASPAGKILTRPEQTGYRETSSFADVLAFIRELQQQSDKLRVETIIHTVEGRDVPMVLAADPLPSSPAEAQRDPRPIVYIQANIHAGEVEGKEALLMLLRDMLTGSRQELLKKNIYLLVPIFNADGNDRMSPDHRAYMPNPEKGVGVRPNGQNYDLNRDYVKTDSREVRAILDRVVRTWDPLVYVDLHTTDGSYHTETVTYLTPRGPNWDPGISGFIWDKLYPELDRTLRSAGIKTLPYGDFEDDFQPEKGWATFPPSPRIGVDYMGLRNRFAILVEMYAYVPFQTRVEHCYAFVVELLQFIASHSPEMKALAARADGTAAANCVKPPDQREPLCLKVDRQPVPGFVVIETFAVTKNIRDSGYPRISPLLDQPKTVQVPYLARFVPVATRELPWAYLIPPGCDTAIRQLLRHGILVERVSAPIHLPVQQFVTKSLKVDPWVSEGHSRLTVEGAWQPIEMDVDSGFYLVRLDQPLARLAASLLEPDDEDSLVAWNFFNAWVTRQWSRELPPLPVVRLMEPHPMITEQVGADDPERW